MSTVRYFNNLYIPPKSPLTEYFNIPSGYYSGEYNFENETLFLISNSQAKTKKGKSFFGHITKEQLLVILTMVVRDRGDKFTAKDLEIISKIQRPKKKEGFLGSRTSPAHHIIPFDVCKNSKLVVRAEELELFPKPKGFVNSDINRLVVSVIFHPTKHDKYSRFIEQILEDEWGEIIINNEENDKELIFSTLVGATYFFRETIEEMRKSGDALTIDDVFQ